MARSDFVKLAEKELRPYGIGPKDFSTRSIGMEAYELIWNYGGQSHRIHLPRDVSNKREIAIFRNGLEKQLREFGVKLLDPAASRIDIEEQLDEIRSELATNCERHSSLEEMFLEWASEQENKQKTFTEELEKRLSNQDVLIAAAFQKLTTPLPAAEPAPSKIQTAHSSPTPQKARVEPTPKKGLEALDEVQKQQWAGIITRMNEEFALDELDLRILFFLHETGKSQTAHTLREAGVWKAVSSATKHLEHMEAGGLVFCMMATKEWGITKRGISALQDAFEDEPEEAVQHSSAFEKIEDGLTEALAFARGEPNHAKVRLPAKPALTVVPSGPRVLKPVEVMPSRKLTYIEKAMSVLLKKEMTIDELQKAIDHPSSQKSLINMLYRCEREDGYIKYFYHEGRVYRVTEKGRAYLTRVYPNHTLAAS